MIGKGDIRLIVFAAVPIFIYATGGVSVLRDTWGEPCSVPCFEVMSYATIQPVTETWAIVGQYGGLVGQVLFIGVILVWMLFFVEPVVRGPI